MLQKTIQITNGPSREELFDGLRLLAEKRLVPFCFEKNENEKYIAAIINSIEAEDGGGQSWNLTFSTNKECVSESFFVKKPEKIEPGVYAKKLSFEDFKCFAEEDYLLGFYRKEIVTIKAYYSTKTRKGVITVE